MLLWIIWQRKTARKHAGKFCLSFFITRDWLHLQDIAIQNDIYLYYWIKTLIPIVNRNGYFEAFMAQNGITDNTKWIHSSDSRTSYKFFHNIVRYMWKK